MRHKRLRRARARGRRGRAPPARGRRGDHRQDERARAGHLAVHRDRDLRRHAQPLGLSSARPAGPAAAAGAAVAAGLVGAALGCRRRRLDPYPRRLVRAVRSEAQRGRVPLAPHPRLGTACRSTACSRATSPTPRCSTTWSAAPARLTSTTSPRPPIPFVDAAATPPGRLRIAVVQRCRPASPLRLGADAERRWTRPLSCCAHSATRSASASSTTGRAPLPEFIALLPARHPRRRARRRTPRAPGTAHACEWRAWARSSLRAARAGAGRQRTGHAAGSRPCSSSTMCC